MPAMVPIDAGQPPVLIGINTAIVGPGEGNVGIGIAIPSNVVRRVVDRIVAAAGR